jgi:hypothetical protein
VVAAVLAFLIFRVQEVSHTPELFRRRLQSLNLFAQLSLFGLFLTQHLVDISHETPPDGHFTVRLLRRQRRATALDYARNQRMILGGQTTECTARQVPWIERTPSERKEATKNHIFWLPDTKSDSRRSACDRNSLVVKDLHNQKTGLCSENLVDFKSGTVL